MDKPILFMLDPWHDEDGTGPFYCPDCGIVEGLFAYNPHIKDQVDIVNLKFKRPRKKIVEVLGRENQGSPSLVLEGSAEDAAGVKKSMTTGRSFIDDPVAICDYLAKRFNGVRPHPQ